MLIDCPYLIFTLTLKRLIIPVMSIEKLHSTGNLLCCRTYRSNDNLNFSKSKYRKDLKIDFDFKFEPPIKR